MKLDDLLEGVQEPLFPKEEVLKAYEEAAKLPEYKRIINLGYSDISTKIHKSRGAFSFGGMGKNARVYKIHAHGMLRTQAIGSDRFTRISVPPLTDDNMLENYKRMLRRVGDIVESRTTGVPLKHLPKDPNPNKYVKNGVIEINDSDITTLEGLPLPKRAKKLDIAAHKETSKLKNLIGAPDEVQDVWLQQLEITSLEGLPKKMKTLYIYSCKRLTSLEGLPPDVETVRLSYCDNIRTLEHLPMSLTSLTIGNLVIPTLEGLGTKFLKRCGTLDLWHFATRSHGLALLLISNKKTRLSWHPGSETDAGKIIHRHVNDGRGGLIECQHDLIEEGFPDQAKI